MMKLISLLCVIAFHFQSAIAINQIKHLENNGATLIETDTNHYALKAPTLDQGPNYWKTIAVNGDRVTIFKSDCQATAKNLSEMSAEEQQSIVDGIPDGSSRQNYGSSSGFSSSSSMQYSYDGSQTFTSGNRYQSSSSSSSSGQQQITTSNDGSGDFSITKTGLPNNLVRVFVVGDSVAFVEGNGQVMMKPAPCLNESESQLVKQLKQDVKTFRDNMDKFNFQFQKNMQSMQQNLNFNMQTLNRNMQKMGENLRQNIMGNQMYAAQLTKLQQNLSTFKLDQLPQQQQAAFKLQNAFGWQPGTSFASSSFNSAGQPYITNAATQQLANSDSQQPSVFGANFPFGPNSLLDSPNFPFNRR